MEVDEQEKDRGGEGEDGGDDVESATKDVNNNINPATETLPIKQVETEIATEIDKGSAAVCVKVLPTKGDEGASDDLMAGSGTALGNGMAA